MEIESKDLVMSFDPKTIQHLGIRMYSTLPPVLAELIANSYDADAENVKITLTNNSQKKEISIEDDGIGMSFTELNTKFLKIGRDRRYEEGTQSTPIKKRKVIGKKGLGKLSFFGISPEVEICTKKGGRENSFVMNWEKIKTSDKPSYSPDIIKKDSKCSEEEHGTKIILRNLKRESDFTPESIADGISKTFIVDPDFKIIIKHNEDPEIVIDNQRKYLDLNKEVEWNSPTDIQLESDYEHKLDIKGHLIATKLPLSSKSNMKGITLFSRKKLVNTPEYFSNSLSSHFFSYLTGWLEVDFIDDIEEDVISTNRQSLNWEHPKMAELRNYLSKLISWLEKDWRIKRAAVREKEVETSTGIKISEWVSKLPAEIKENVEPLVRTMIRNFEPTEEAKEINTNAIRSLHSLAPEYIYWHYRHLHPEIQSSSKEKYIEGDYYRAFQEAIKRYINNIRLKVNDSSLNSQDARMLEQVFGKGPESRLQFPTSKYLKPDNNPFNDATIKSVINSQHQLSQGASAGENPLSHEEIINIISSKLFTEEDCLNLLSTLSHLSRRLDDFEKN